MEGGFECLLDIGCYSSDEKTEGELCSGMDLSPA